MIEENNIEITDAVQIRQEQKQFYEKLYTSSKPILDDSHKSLFLNEANPFITKLSNEAVSKCEGYLTFQECLSSIKNMKNGKSPGLDGFTVEFYKFFGMI